MPEAQENEPAPSMQDGAEPEGEVCVPVGSGNCCEDACGQLEKRVSGLHETMCRMQSLLGAMYQGQQQMGMVQDSIVRGMQALQDKVENVVESQELTIQKQHNAALKYQEDVIYKIQKNLIMELIGISDNIRMILQNNESEPGYDLLAAVKDLGAWVDASLSNNSVRRFQDTTMDATTMNRKRQQLVDKEPTDVEAEHNTYRTVSPGYEWSVPYLVVNSEVQLKKILEENAAPQMFTYVIRPEEIVKLEYSENNKEE
jgi:molecular chaperone GrpE (heat shock protein)